MNGDERTTTQGQKSMYLSQYMKRAKMNGTLCSTTQARIIRHIILLMVFFTLAHTEQSYHKVFIRVFSKFGLSNLAN